MTLSFLYCHSNIFFNLYQQSAQPDPIEIQRQQESRRRTIARKRAKQQLRPKSPDPVEGRKHIDVQTELYLEELSDRMEEADVECQTDAFLDRPPSPLFIPAKTGVDVATEILEGDVSVDNDSNTVNCFEKTRLRSLNVLMLLRKGPYRK